MVFRLICLLAFLFSCAEKKEYNAETESRPKVVEAKGYVVPKDSLAAPEVFPVNPDSVKKYPAVIQKVGAAFSNVKPAGKPVLIPIGQPDVCTPGKNGFSLPKTVSPVFRPVPARQPEPVRALPMRKRDQASFDIRYLDLSQGLGNSMVQSVIKDKTGSLWMATFGGGLIRYDGQHFFHYTIREGLGSNYLWNLCPDKQGNIWFGTIAGNKGAGFFNGDGFTHFTTKDGLCDDNIASICRDSSGNIWLASWEGGVSKFDGRCFTTYTEKEGLLSNRVDAITCDQSGNVWFGTKKGICKFDGQSFSHYTEKNGLPPGGYNAVFQDKSGKLWFGSNSGLFGFDGRTIKKYSTANGLFHNKIQTITEDKAGNLWLGTFGGGLCRFDGNSFTNWGEKEGIHNLFVWSVLEDASGCIWFGTNGGGLGRLDPRSFQHFSRKEGLKDPYMYSILEDRSGTIWFASNTEGVFCFDGKSFSSLSPKTTDQRERMYFHSIFEDDSGNLWFGSNRRLWLYNGKELIHYGKIQGLPDDVIIGIQKDKKGHIWFSTLDNGVFRFDGKSFTRYSEKSGLSTKSVKPILKDRSGNLWIGTTGGGLNKFDGKRFTHYRLKGAEGCNNVNALKEDEAGRLWIGTDGGGVFRFDGKSFIHYTEADGLSQNYIYSILCDSERRVWLGTDRGLNCMEMADDVAKPSIRIFHAEDGLNSEDFVLNAVVQDSKNRIWWGGGKTVTMLNLNAFSFNENVPMVSLSHLELQGKFTDFAEILRNRKAGNTGNGQWSDLVFQTVRPFRNYPENPEFPYDIRHLTFHFSAIDWASPDQLKFRFRLDKNGGEGEWSRPSAENKADFRDMSAGNYTLTIQAIGSAGKWSKPFDYSFVIRPPWWHTWWAFCLYILAGLGGISGFIRWRETSLRERQKELEEKVTEATGEILEQKQVIEEKHRQVLGSIEYARRIQSSILPPPKIVQQYLEESFILYLPKDIVAGDFYWMTEVEGEILFAACDCTGHGVPGAMVSVVCSNALNKTVKELGITEPARMLDKVSELVQTEFQNSGNEEDLVRDGMDISLCRLDLKNRHLQWAGANNPLWMVRNTDGETELIEVKADRQSVGSSTQPFKNHSISLQNGDCLYLFSDGYCDQFGGPEEKKFSKRRFRELLLSMANEGMTVQREKLVKRHLEWKGNRPQVDDICVIGVRV